MFRHSPHSSSYSLEGMSHLQHDQDHHHDQPINSGPTSSLGRENSNTNWESQENESLSQRETEKSLLNVLEDYPKIWKNLDNRRRKKRQSDKWRLITQRTQLSEAKAKECLKKIKGKIEYRLNKGIKDGTIVQEKFVIGRDSSLAEFYNKHRFEHWEDAKYLTNMILCRKFNISPDVPSIRNAPVGYQFPSWRPRTQRQPPIPQAHQRLTYNQIIQQEDILESSAMLQNLGSFPRRPNAPVTVSSITMPAATAATSGLFLPTQQQQQHPPQMEQQYHYQPHTVMMNASGRILTAVNQPCSTSFNQYFPTPHEQYQEIPQQYQATEQQELRCLHGFEAVRVKIKNEPTDDEQSQASRQRNPLQIHWDNPGVEIPAESLGLTPEEVDKRVRNFQGFREYINGLTTNALAAYYSLFESSSFVANYLAMDENLTREEVEQKLTSYIMRLRNERL